MKARSQRWSGIDAALPWACVGAAVAWLVAVAVRFPHGDGDLLWQRWLGERILREHAIPRSLGGETFAAPGAPWTPHEWLFSTALAWTTDHAVGWTIPVLCAFAVGVALAAVVLRSRARGVSPGTASAGVVLCTLASIQSFGARGQVLGWGCLAAFVLLLELEGPWMWAAVPLTVVWANLHASAMLAPAVAANFAVAAFVRDGGWSRAGGRAALVALACGIATLMTPLGTDLPRYAAGLLTSPIRASIAEWGATSIASAGFVIGALPLLLVLAVFGVRASVRDRIVAVLFTLMLFSAVRNVPVFALIVAPIALATLPARGEQGTPRFAHSIALATLATIVVCASAITVLTWRVSPSSDAVLPLTTSRALLSQTAEPRVFCEDFAWCSVFLGRRATFFMDGRCDPYPPAIWREYRTVIDGNRGWDKVLARYRIDAVLARRDSALDSLLAERGATWRSIAVDGPSRLYVRSATLTALR